MGFLNFNDDTNDDTNEREIMCVFICGSAIVVAVSMVFTGCQPLIEINMVNRSTMDSGDGVSSTRKELTSKQEEDKLQLVVPIR